MNEVRGRAKSLSGQERRLPKQGDSKKARRHSLVDSVPKNSLVESLVSGSSYKSGSEEKDGYAAKSVENKGRWKLKIEEEFRKEIIEGRVVLREKRDSFAAKDCSQSNDSPLKGYPKNIAKSNEGESSYDNSDVSNQRNGLNAPERKHRRSETSLLFGPGFLQYLGIEEDSNAYEAFSDEADEADAHNLESLIQRSVSISKNNPVSIERNHSTPNNNHYTDKSNESLFGYFKEDSVSNLFSNPNNQRKNDHKQVNIDGYNQDRALPEGNENEAESEASESEGFEETVGGDVNETFQQNVTKEHSKSEPMNMTHSTDIEGEPDYDDEQRNGSVAQSSPSLGRKRTGSDSIAIKDTNLGFPEGEVDQKAINKQILNLNKFVINNYFRNEDSKEVNTKVSQKNKKSFIFRARTLNKVALIGIINLGVGLLLLSLLSNPITAIILLTVGGILMLPRGCRFLYNFCSAFKSSSIPG